MQVPYILQAGLPTWDRLATDAFPAGNWQAANTGAIPLTALGALRIFTAFPILPNGAPEGLRLAVYLMVSFLARDLLTRPAIARHGFVDTMLT